MKVIYLLIILILQRMDTDLEREKAILWQRFLAEPDTLRMRYEEAKQKANESHFGDTVESKVNQ